MAPLFVLAAATLLASPPRESNPIAVLVVRRTSVDAEHARALAETVATLLEKSGVAVEPPAETLRRLVALGIQDTTQCGGRKACVLELLRQAECPAGIALSVSQVGAETSVALEALRARDGSVLAKDAMILKRGETLDAASVTSIARVLAKAWPAQPKADAQVAAGEPAPRPVEPAPKPVEPAPVLTPKPVEPMAAAVVAQPEPATASRSHVGGIVTLAAAVVAAGVAAGFAGGAFSARGQLEQNNGALSPYRGSEAQMLANAANQRGAIAAGAGVLSAGLVVTAVVVW
jgi:hypothetical protein